MAEKKYLNLEGLQDVANHVNTRLKTVTTIPASADDGAVRLYVGETGVTYKKGHIYQYNATDLEWVDITSSSEYTAGNGIDITDDEISVETYMFIGTQAQWDALTTEQKKEYDICNITDDASSDDEIYTKSEIDAILGTDYQKKDLETAIEGQTTVVGALGALSTNKATQAEVNDIVNVLGAKNLLPFNLEHIKKVNGGGTWNGNVYTYRDITYTVNADGTIIVDGTASADSIFRVLDNAGLDFALSSGKTYYYTGSPATGSSASTYYSYYSELVGGTWTYFMSYGTSDTSITPNASATQIVVDIFVKSGETIDNQIFKPMIRLASDPDNTYVPYAKTNRELTDVIPSDASVSNKLVTESELKNTYTLTRVDEHTCTFDLSILPYTLNGVCLISLVGGYNLQSSVVCSIGYYNEWRVDGLTTLVNASNVGTITVSVSGSILTISNTGTNYNGMLSIRVGQLFNV